MPFDFKGKLAVVTGGANGIGLATTKLLHGAGAEVWVFDLEAENPEAKAAGVGAKGHAVDVTDPETMERAFERTGVPDILVASSGIATYGEVSEIPVEDWNRTINVNLSGVFHTVQIASRLMKARRSGSIVVTASTNSYDGEPTLTSYNASKAGLLGIVHTAAAELGPYGIRINAVCPGFIRTRLTADSFARPEVVKKYFREVPLGRGGEPEEVANAIAFLASDAASYITGATLLVDGGQMATKFGTWDDDIADFDTDHWRLKPGE